MIVNTLTISDETHKRALAISESTFDTQDHPDQMPVTQASFEKLRLLSPDSILYEVESNGDPVAWVVRMPTTIEIMRKFVNKEINEREILEMSVPARSYSAVYLCAAVTLPEFRRRGLYLRLSKEALSRLPLDKDYELFAWPTSEEGKLALKKLESETGKVIHIRE